MTFSGRARNKRSRATKPAIGAASVDSTFSDVAGKSRTKNEKSTEGVVRRCTHCASEKTPQWRTGPLGPKTLCNACGVRYKSGRLVLEYRSVASPTFVHSNSHRKVMKLRRQKEKMEEQEHNRVTARGTKTSCYLSFNSKLQCYLHHVMKSQRRLTG